MPGRLSTYDKRGFEVFPVFPCIPSGPRWGRLLLPRSACRNLEVHAMVVVGFACGGEIEVGEENLVGAARAEVKQSIAHDGIVDHVGLMAVFENEHSRRLSGHGLFRLARSWFG